MSVSQFSPQPHLPQAAKGGARRLARQRRYPTFRAIAALMMREMSTTYGRTPGGYLWAILEPVVGIAVLTLSFSFMMLRPAIGSSFELFYATGMLPFLMTIGLINRVGTSLLFSKSLLAYPAVTFVDAIVARFLVNFLTSLLVFYIVTTGVLVLFDTHAVLDVRKIALSLALCGVFGLSVGVMNAYLFMRFPLWHVIWSLVSKPLMLISGVLFIYQWLPLPLRDYIWYNPLIQLVGLMRGGFYPSYNDSYVSVTYLLLLSMLLTMVGLLLLRKEVNRLLYDS